MQTEVPVPPLHHLIESVDAVDCIHEKRRLGLFLYGRRALLKQCTAQFFFHTEHTVFDPVSTLCALVFQNYRENLW